MSDNEHGMRENCAVPDCHALSGKFSRYCDKHKARAIRYGDASAKPLRWRAVKQHCEPAAVDYYNRIKAMPPTVHAGKIAEQLMAFSRPDSVYWPERTAGEILGRLSWTAEDVLVRVLAIEIALQGPRATMKSQKHERATRARLLISGYCAAAGVDISKVRRRTLEVIGGLMMDDGLVLWANRALDFIGRQQAAALDLKKKASEFPEVPS